MSSLWVASSKAEVDDILWRDAQETRPRHAQEAVDVSRIAGAYLERAVNIGKAVGVAIDEAVDRQVLLVGKQADEAPRGAGRDPAHLDDDASRGFPKPVIVEALKHAAGFDREHESRIGAESQMFDRARDAVGAAAQIGAVDLDGRSGRGISVDHGQPTRDRAAVGFRVEAQLFPRQPVHRRHGLDVVHDGVRFGLFVEAAISPVLADVIDLALGGEVVMLDHRSRGRHQAQGLRERPRGGHRQRAHLARIAKLEITLRFVIGDIVEAADRKLDVRQLSALDAGADLRRRPDSISAMVLLSRSLRVASELFFFMARAFASCGSCGARRRVSSPWSRVRRY